MASGKPTRYRREIDVRKKNSTPKNTGTIIQKNTPTWITMGKSITDIKYLKT